MWSLGDRSRILAGTAALVGAVVAIVLAPSPADAVTVHRDLSYDLDSPPAPAPAAQNWLDLYLPDGAQAGDSRPVVAYVHGGGWAIGDKAAQIADKVELFTGAGYVFASLNYRLSPSDGDPENPDPGRVKFPDHPRDVGEAIGWLDRHVAEYGGDPTRILLIGHSAGAHLVSLVSTDPGYVGRYGVEPWQLIGTTVLDTDAHDVAERIATGGPSARAIFYNAFGTPAENAATNAWALASPINWASAADPEFLLVTQAANTDRTTGAREMAAALGQDPSRSVFLAPYDHAGINDAVGSSADPAGETTAIMAFFADMVAAATAPKAKLRRHPPRRLRTPQRRPRVRFSFKAVDPEAEFECRVDDAEFKRCRSPHSVRVGRGGHRFRVRALSERGRPGAVTSFRFRVTGPRTGRG